MWDNVQFHECHVSCGICEGHGEGLFYEAVSQLIFQNVGVRTLDLGGDPFSSATTLLPLLS